MLNVGVFRLDVGKVDEAKDAFLTALKSINDLLKLQPATQNEKHNLEAMRNTA